MEKLEKLDKLKVYDSVLFIYKGKHYQYHVRESFLQADKGYDNYKIFNVLGIEDKDKFCSDIYGYPSKGGDFPSFRRGDMEAATKVVRALFKLTGQHCEDYEGTDTVCYPSTQTLTTSTTQPLKKMSLISKFKSITRSEPNKTFVKAGVMNEDLSLTSEGKELFIQFMFEKHATEFKTDVVNAILKEQESKD